MTHYWGVLGSQTKIEFKLNIQLKYFLELRDQWMTGLFIYVKLFFLIFGGKTRHKKNKIRTTNSRFKLANAVLS